MLERYDVKMSCTVLRREKAGNRFFLSDAINTFAFMLAKNIAEIKLFIKELDGKNRSNRKTYILVRNCREGSLFCDVHLITITQNKEHLFLSYCQSQVKTQLSGTFMR